MGEKLSKKQKKALEFRRRKKGLEPEEEPEQTEQGEQTEQVEQSGDAHESKEPESQSRKKKPKNNGPRFIAFVGNLPYNISEDEIAHHFKSCPPSAIRLRKGFAFAEFDGHDGARRLKVALRLHHTTIRDRKINVELTAGGGGNSAHRRQKIEQRRKKLQQEHHDRITAQARATAAGSKE